MISKLTSNKIRSVHVLGSTSDVAQSLCLELARRGCKKFHLVARSDIKNKIFAKRLLENKNLEVTTEYFDLCSETNSNELKYKFIEDYDLYLITAGYLGDNKEAREDFSEALRIFDSNIRGLIPWLTLITTEKRLSTNSRLWVLSSVAADRGRQSNYHYGAAKAALNIFLEGLMIRSAQKAFSVRVIKTGYINTKMISGKRVPKFLITNTKSFTNLILRNINKRGFEYLPYWWGPIMLIIKILPRSLMGNL